MLERGATNTPRSHDRPSQRPRAPGRPYRSRRRRPGPPRTPCARRGASAWRLARRVVTASAVWGRSLCCGRWSGVWFA